MAVYEYYPLETYDVVCKAVTEVNEYIQHICEAPIPTVRVRIDEFCEDCVEVYTTWPLEQAVHKGLMINVVDIQIELQSVVIKSFIDGFIAAYNTNHHPEESHESPID